MAFVRAQAADSARVVVPGRGVLLLLRPLLRRAVHRVSRAGKSGTVQATDCDDHHPPAGKGRLVVRLSLVQLSPTIRHGVCPHDTGQMPACNQMNTRTQSRTGVPPAQRRRRDHLWPLRGQGRRDACPTFRRWRAFAEARLVPFLLVLAATISIHAAETTGKFLYVAEPGIRNDL